MLYRYREQKDASLHSASALEKRKALSKDPSIKAKIDEVTTKSFGELRILCDQIWAKVGKNSQGNMDKAGFVFSLCFPLASISFHCINLTDLFSITYCYEFPRQGKER
jgi:hypothetical protein